MNYGFVIDNRSCIGCHACSTACKSENEVPLGVYRTWVKSVETGAFPDVTRSFQVTRCNHCANPPCVRICPTSAMHQRDDGIVDFDSDACIGCKACLQACPYDAIYLDPESHTAAKCNYCVHRVEVGLEPACVVVCPEHAILAGDLDDPHSEIARAVAKHQTTVRKPEQGTAPKLFYIDGHDASMHPTAAEPGRSFAFADTRDHMIGRPGTLEPYAQATRVNDRGDRLRIPDHQGFPAGGPFQAGGRKAAELMRVSYNVQHKVQWHWPIPAYVVTKHIAGGGAFLLALGTLIGIDPKPVVYVWALSLVLACLGVTLALLIYDLDRPDRFFFLLTRPQWRSWLARAAWILTAFAVVTTAWWGIELAVWFETAPGLVALRPIAAVLALPLGLLTSAYTAFLFAQAEGRDLWQGAHLPIVMGAQGIMLGAASVMLVAAQLNGTGAWFGAFAGVHLVVATVVSLAATVLGDLGIPHATEVARRAAHEMIRGAFRVPYWTGVALAHLPMFVLVLVSPEGPGWVAALSVVTAAMCVGVFLQSWALVMAPQTVENS
jgi:Fe-S-cluster-containing dehydrogenase component/formate-dependent nitrite reductase membrane component NrfD